MKFITAVADLEPQHFTGGVATNKRASPLLLLSVEYEVTVCQQL